MDYSYALLALFFFIVIVLMTVHLHILADHEHPFWPMVNTNSGAS